MKKNETTLVCRICRYAAVVYDGPFRASPGELAADSSAADDPEPIAADDLRSLFEAARWAASAFNEQPWHYLVAVKEDQAEFARLLSCLVPANQAWAQAAPVLVLTVVRDNYARNGKTNHSARHDMGLASATLTFEATSRGLAVHQMAGIIPEKAVDIFNIPNGFSPVTGLAIGRAAELSTLPDDIRERDSVARTRRQLNEFVFTSNWGRPAKMLGEG